MTYLEKIDEFNKEAGETVIRYSDEIFASIVIIALYLLKRIKELEKK